ncbi:MAG: LicD family protein [Synergistaceae bacterium]|nr:LicD family protein [Synergistaceae bacterium]
MKGLEYVLREMTADEVKKTQLEILGVVMDFCAENGINCWLNAGTLLGAVRHKGYIPWDDDIDLGMLRPDYDKFMAVFNGYNTRYEFRCYENDPESFEWFGKVFDTSTVLYEPDEKGEKLSVYVDIFVMDNAPEDKAEQNRMFRRREILRVCNLGRKLPVFLRPTRGGFMRWLAVYAFRAVLRVFPRHYFVRKLVENTKLYSRQDTGLAGDFTGVRSAVIRRELLENMTQLEFEGKMYNVPAGYKEWLTALYGDYMQLPPAEERVSTHFYKAYCKD